MESTFNDAIRKLNQSLCRRTFGNEILYRMCLHSDYPWGDACRLAEKMRLIGKLNNCILERGYIKFDEKGNEIEHYRFKGNTDELYEKVAEQLIEIKDDCETFDGLLFDGSMDDWSILAKSIFAVFQLEDAITEAIRIYNSDSGFIDDTNLPSYIEFCSAFLHYHFPQCFFIFDLRTDHSGRFLFSDYQCELCSVPVRIGINKRLKEEYDVIYGLCQGVFTPDIVPKLSKRSSFVGYCARAYTLGCYLKKNCDIKGNIYFTDFIPEVFKKTKSGFKVEAKNWKFKLIEQPSVSVDDLYKRCKDVNDCNLLLGEYIKLRKEKARENEISKLILQHYPNVDEELSLKIAKMVLTYEKYAMSGGKCYSAKNGEIVLNEYAASRTSVEFSYSGSNLREFIKFCISKLALN